jgi:VWFA-related protein
MQFRFMPPICHIVEMTGESDMKRRVLFSAVGSIIFCLFFLMACGGGGGESAPPSPRILVSSTQIDFGDIILDDIAEQAYTIRNVGSSTLTLGQIAQTDPLAPPFSIVNDNCSGTALTANKECPFTVLFSPTSQGKGFTDSFDIPSNDPNFATVTVGVVGNAEGLRLSINQTTTDTCQDIELHIAVFDKDGFPISELTTDNVALFENDDPNPKTIELNPAISIMPVSVALVLDFSDSLNLFYENVIDSSKQFVDLLHPDDEAAVFKFAKTIELKQTFTDNIIDLQSAIDNAYTGLGTEDVLATVVYDALWDAIDLTADRPNNLAIVLISDGKDEDPADGKGSEKTLTEVIDHAKDTGVSIFTIGLGSPVSVDVMNELAQETGGQYFAAPNSDQLAGIYQAIRDILNGQYIITYTSTASDPITVNVQVDTGVFQGDAVKQIQGCP